MKLLVTAALLLAVTACVPETAPARSSGLDAVTQGTATAAQIHELLTQTANSSETARFETNTRLEVRMVGEPDTNNAEPEAIPLEQLNMSSEGTTAFDGSAGAMTFNLGIDGVEPIDIYVYESTAWIKDPQTQQWEESPQYSETMREAYLAKNIAQYIQPNQTVAYQGPETLNGEQTHKYRTTTTVNESNLVALLQAGSIPAGLEDADVIGQDIIVTVWLNDQGQAVQLSSAVELLDMFSAILADEPAALERVASITSNYTVSFYDIGTATVPTQQPSDS